MREPAVHRRSQSKDQRTEKRTAKNPPPTCLTKALSEIAQDMPNVGVVDVATFANRSIETRQTEASKAGKVKRPLNAFMLYRKAYQDIAKTQCSRNNHQQVSSICGTSWNSWEPPGILSRFKQLASIEKQMHEDAFPAYKYDPVQVKKPTDGLEQDSAALCDLSDGEASCRRSRRAVRQRTGRSMSRMRQSFALEPPAQHPVAPGGDPTFLGPVWQPYQAAFVPDWYRHGGIPTDGTSYTGYTATQPAADGLPMNPSYGCASSGLHFQPYGPYIDPCLDPSLRSENQGSQYGPLVGNSQDMLADWINVAGTDNAALPLVPDLDAGGADNAYLRGGEGDWQIEQLEDGSHFSDWITQTRNGTL